MTTPQSEMTRNVVVTVLAAVIIALGSAVILHGRDLVELQTKIIDLEKRVDILSSRPVKPQNP